MAAARIRHIGLKRAFDATVGRAHIAGAGAVVATSALEAAELSPIIDPRLIRIRPGPLEVPNEVAPDPSLRVRLGVPATALLAVSVGRISRKKNLDVLAGAIARTAGVHLVVAGPDDGDGASGRLGSTIKAQGVSDRVHVIGPLWGADRDRLVATADVFVLASKTENFGHAAAEAAGLGTPVVVTNRCGIAEVVAAAEGGLVVPLGVAALAEALASLRDDPALRRRLGLGARSFLDRLSPSRLAHCQEEIYDWLLAQRGRSGAALELGSPSSPGGMSE